MGDSRKLDVSQRQELGWLLDEADSAIESWWQTEEARWPEILTKLVSRLRLCRFDLEADGIASEVQATPKIGVRGCCKRGELRQHRQRVVERVRKRITAIRKVIAVEPTDAAGGDGDGQIWQEVQAELERLRLQGERYSSQQKLADRIGCTKFLVQKAIANGPVELREWASRQRGASRKNASQKAAAAAFDKTPQGREDDPAEKLHDCDVDIVLAKLLDEASPKERARINGMTPAEKRQLAETVYRDPDTEEQAKRLRQANRSRRD